jgi:hypothetical protein
MVTRNEVALLIEPGGIELDTARLGRLLALVEALPPDVPPSGSGEVIDHLRCDAAAVDPALQQLLPMVRQWASGDDTHRKIGFSKPATST